MDQRALVIRNEDLPSAAVDLDRVFLNAATDSYVALDEIGCRIWELIETPWRVGDLADELSGHFNGPRSAIAADVLGFLDELEREGMVRVAGQRPA